MFKCFFQATSALCLLLLSPLFLSAQCDDGRYYDPIFSLESNLPSAIQYGENLDYEGQNVQLEMRVFQPADDPAVSRPLIILAHGGSFLEGIKESPDILTLCSEFARRGYVTATISYRLGAPTVDSLNMLRAVVRGVQDAQAAVRFFYKDAQTDNEFRIDTSQIFVGGVSAGAFIGLHLGYMRDTSVLQPYIMDIINDMGGIEGSSGNQGYSSDIKGVINLCGAIGDSVWIQPGGPICVSMHGTDDGTVPYGSDIIRVSGNDIMMVDGSASVDIRMQNAGIDHDFYTFHGAGHVPFVNPLPPPLSDGPLYMDTTIAFVRDFLVKHTECPELMSSVDEYQFANFVHVYPNPVSNHLNLASNEHQIESVVLYDMTGRVMLKKELNDHFMRIDVRSKSAGMYLLKVRFSGSDEIFTERVQIF